jgi:hypothetical protein
MNGISISIVEGVFDSNKHNIETYANSNVIVSIDGNEPFGTSFELPKTYVKRILATYQRETYNLESSDMYNAWGNRLKYAPSSIYFWGECADKYNCTFRGLFADAGAAFSAEWKIINGKSVRTIIMYGSATTDFLNIRHTLNLYKNKPIKADSRKMDSAIRINLTNGISVAIKKDSFDKNRFKIEKCEHANIICLINDRVPFGTSQTLYKPPKTYLENITVIYKNAYYSLDVSDMYDMDLIEFGGTCHEYLNSCAFRGVFSNGESNFAVQWRLDVINNSSRRSVLTFSKDIVDDFLEHIDANIFYD